MLSPDFGGCLCCQFSTREIQSVLGDWEGKDVRCLHDRSLDKFGSIIGFFESSSWFDDSEFVRRPDLGGPLSSYERLASGPSPEIIPFGVVVGAHGAIPEENQPPSEFVEESFWFDAFTWAGPRPKRRVLDRHFVEKVLIDPTRVRCLPSASNRMLEEEPSYEDDGHHWDRYDEVPFDAGVIREGVNIHAKEADHERQWQENEGNPAEPPHAGIEL